MIGPRKMLILSGSTPLYVLLLRGSGTPRYRPSSGRPSGGSSSTTISTLLIAAWRSADNEFRASSIASSNGSLGPAAERASISTKMPESVLTRFRFWASAPIFDLVGLGGLVSLRGGSGSVFAFSRLAFSRQPALAAGRPQLQLSGHETCFD